ncbi:hypothetical protein Aperf_G00000062635 [Anoplocephala perfoliata]
MGRSRKFGLQLKTFGRLLDLQHSNPNFMNKLLSDSLLKDRIPVVNHNSVYLITPSLIGPGYNNPVIRAANLVYSSLRFFESLRNGKLRPDLNRNPSPSIIKLQNFDRFINVLPSLLATCGAYLFRVFPLDMSPYQYLFQSSRIPDFGMDRLASSADSRHIAVISQGEFYYFDVFDQQISSALTGPGGSRWFDKTLSLLVNQHGDAALNVADGFIPASAVLRFANSIFNDAETRPAADPWLLESTQRLPRETLRRMEWHLDEAFYEEVLLPQHDVYQAQRADLQVAYLAEEGERTLSKRLCDRANVCSDAMMQIALLIAHERMHGEAGFKGGSAEVCSTRSFYGGGEALARPLTLEARDFLRLVRSEKIPGFTDEDDLIESLRRCSRMHQSLLKETMAGHSWDSHLFALCRIAESSDKSILGLFNDETYQRIKNADLHTISLTSDTVSASPLRGLLTGARLPISTDGYGIVYRITESGCNVCVTTRRESSSFSKVTQFAEAVRKSLRQLANIL